MCWAYLQGVRGANQMRKTHGHTEQATEHCQWSLPQGLQVGAAQECLQHGVCQNHPLHCAGMLVLFYRGFVSKTFCLETLLSSPFICQNHLIFHCSYFLSFLYSSGVVMAFLSVFLLQDAHSFLLCGCRSHSFYYKSGFVIIQAPVN